MELLIWIFIIGAAVWWYMNRRKAPGAAAEPAVQLLPMPSAHFQLRHEPPGRSGATVAADRPAARQPAPQQAPHRAPDDADDVDGWTESAAAEAASMHDPAARIHRPGPTTRPGQEQHGRHGPCRASEFPSSPGTGTGTSRHCGWDGSESEEIVHHHAGSNRSGYPFDPSETPFGPGSAFAAWNGSGPDGFLIKGNGTSMIYHQPGMPSYADTKAEFWFQTVEQAEAAGFRPPKGH